ncbi:MAG: membrane protein insertion efficiency factor YidD [bacterium]
MPTPKSSTASRRGRWPLNRFAIWTVRLYQKRTADKPHKCLHYPTCSTFSILAFEKYGFFLASLKTMKRIRLCNPFSTLPYEDYP